ncbi:MAG TPA: UvrB/UvrC motif-containing protein [Gemmataceae bacterium]|nr:UvrB/UvrC motif-containing protein [Gemmataceae bacterium]
MDAVLHGWEYKPNLVQARLVRAADGRQVIQMRVDLGVLQMETTGRPDGSQPHGRPTYFDYLKQQAREADRAGRPFVLNEEQCEEADREFVQYYHRRICWLALRDYARAVADADHTLAFMTFVCAHSPDEDYAVAHEQYRGFVLFQRTQAAAALATEQNDPEKAIDAVNAGLKAIQEFLAAHDLAEEAEDNGMIRHLRKMERSLRQLHGIEATLQEQLEQAVANEEYETAARIRDALKRRQ